MPSTTEIANMAISHLGVGTRILNLETEKSAEAAACRTFFDMARDKCLRDFHWPFATRIEALGLIEELPNNEWGYSYAYPSDCLMFRKIQSGLRNDSRQTRVSYREAQKADQKVIFTDMPNAIGEWTIRYEDTANWPADFILAFSYLLAHFVAPRLTGGDPFKLGEAALAKYSLEIGNAKANSSNEDQPDEEVESEFIRAREGVSEWRDL